MLHIFLVILKIIGIVLAVLIGFLLLLMLALIFVPFQYRLEGSFDTEDQDKQNYFKGKISFLGPLLRCTVSYKEEFQWNIKILFISLNSFFEKTGTDFKENNQHKNNEFGRADCEETLDDSEADDGLELINLESHKHRKEKIRDEDDTIPEKARQTTNTKKKNKFGGWRQKIKAYQEKAQRSLESGRSLISLAHCVLRTLKELKADLRFKAAYRLIKRRLLLFLNKIKPSIHYFHASFATSDPALTGKIVGAASIIYACLHNPAIKVAPDFESEQFYFKGKARIAGKIWILDIIKLAYAYFFDQEVQYFKEKLSNIRRNFDVRK